MKAKDETSRIMIHVDSLDTNNGTHPRWKGADNVELSTCPFEDVSVQSTSEMTAINSRLELMLDKAPSDSSANLLVRKTKDGYKAFLRIRSVNSRFASFIFGAGLIDVVEKVILDVRSQIERWKQTRTLKDETV